MDTKSNLFFCCNKVKLMVLVIFSILNFLMIITVKLHGLWNKTQVV